MVAVQDYSCKMPGGVTGEYGRICPNTGVTRYSLTLGEEGTIRRMDCSLLYYKDHLQGLEFQEPVHYGV